MYQWPRPGICYFPQLLWFPSSGKLCLESTIWAPEKFIVTGLVIVPTGLLQTQLEMFFFLYNKNVSQLILITSVQNPRFIDLIFRYTFSHTKNSWSLKQKLPIRFIQHYILNNLKITIMINWKHWNFFPYFLSQYVL